MPLSQDDPSLDYDGSWGDASAGWPKLEFTNILAAQSAYIAAWRDVKVPYGSYVLVGLELRLETQEYVDRVRDFLKDGRSASEQAVAKALEPARRVREAEERLREAALAWLADPSRAGGHAENGCDCTRCELARAAEDLRVAALAVAKEQSDV